MATFVNDTFTDTGGTAITSHTGETGATWTNHASYTAGLTISDANRVRQGVGTGTTACAHASGTPASAEYDIEAVIRKLSTLDCVLGAAGRIATGANTMYIWRWKEATTLWELTKIVAGAGTSLGTYTDTFTTGTDRTIKLEIRDAAKKLYVDGVERISSADNAITAAGLAGMRHGGAGGASNTTGQHLDSLTASDPAVAGKAPPPFCRPLRVWRRAA